MPPRPPSGDEPVADAVTVLLRMAAGEMALARAEIAASLRRAVLGVALLFVTMVLLLIALHALADAATLGLVAAGVPLPWAPAIVGGVLLLLGAGLAAWAVSALRPSRLIPTRTAARLRRDIAFIKEMIRHEP